MAYPWYAVRVRSNFEQTTAKYLEDIGYEVFVPTYEERRRGYDRVRRVRLPLFPGYVVCRMNIDDRLPVLSAPGVVHIVGFGSGFVCVPDDEIAAVRVIVASGVPAERWPYLNVGERVRIVDGPLAGVSGILLDIKNKQRLVVSVHLMQRSVAADIDRSIVQPEMSTGVASVRPGYVPRAL